jgi:Domain of unknown function (DUF5655)
VTRWTCPACEREFGRARQAHTCVPGCTVDETFTGRPAVQRAICDEIVAYLNTLGPLHVDAVGVGVFLKREAKIAELRPQARALSMWLALPRTVRDPRIGRTLPTPTGRTWHVLKLTDLADVDGQLRDWLAESYHAAG